MNYEPGAPLCFFSKTWIIGSMCGRIFKADFALKSRGFGEFGSRSGREEIIENCCERNVRGIARHSNAMPG
jgi:hypothetical protein